MVWEGVDVGFGDGRDVVYVVGYIGYDFEDGRVECGFGCFLDFSMVYILKRVS